MKMERMRMKRTLLLLVIFALSGLIFGQGLAPVWFEQIKGPCSVSREDCARLVKELHKGLKRGMKPKALPENQSRQSEYNQQQKRPFHSHAFHFHVFNILPTTLYYTIYIINHKSLGPTFLQIRMSTNPSPSPSVNIGHYIQKVDKSSYWLILLVYLK